MTKEYRNGAVGALMDEYERAASELKNILMEISQADFIKIVDPETANPACRSIQTIMNHVVRAGYGYANYIRKQFNDPWIERKVDYNLDTPQVACAELDQMLVYTLVTLEGKWDLSFEAIMGNKMRTTWGEDYNFEQLMEHAIVHILRHRRQIERFLMML